MLYLLALVVYGLDQFLKWLIQSTMYVGQGIPIWPGVLEIRYIRNPGAAWGILDQAHWLLIVVALAVVGVVVWVERKYRPRALVTVALAFVLGGALGNMSDRLFAGTVVDYVYFRIINFPIFNLADVAIDVGVFLLLWKSFKADKDYTSKPGDVGK